MGSSTVHRLVRCAVGLAVIGGTISGCTTDPIRSTLRRPADPVVLTGSQVTRLIGAPTNRVVAFRASSQGWSQMPVQVDEIVADKNVADIYNGAASGTNTLLDVYADPDTFVGADPTAGVDADDEIAFMANDAGGLAPASLAPPAGTVAGSGVQVRLNDPDDTAAVGYVYLFRSDGSLDPGAGRQYVQYDFNLLSGDYKTTYKLGAGPNPENSTVTGATYKAHFSDRWVFDQLNLTAGNQPNADLIDRGMYRFPPPIQCVRTEETFKTGEGAFVVNRTGPVRALRSYFGANSGPNTQATHAFYSSSVETTIDLRVHSIPGVGATLDLSSAASGMTFRSPQVPNGVPVNGAPDTVPTGTPSWWTYVGNQGGLGVATKVQTNLSITPQTFYQDSVPASGHCSGDGNAYGEAGAFFNTNIACTDPAQGCTNTLRTTFRIVATPSTMAPAEVQRITAQALRPLTTTITNRG